ncbi:DUF5819 family protein [Streptomyces sp. NPDC058045]|uniref:DUF5819 family protein n=1 Tax=Streptomyces sp. NPDC058045 TaxID=3346311 RepID=UPI0036EE5C5C
MDAHDRGTEGRAGEDGPGAPPAEAPPDRSTPQTPAADHLPRPREAGAGLAALSFRYQVVGALALAVIGVVACTHLAMVFLHVAPSNTMTKQHGQAVDDWVYPEFEQNWKLFAPNPLQQNIAVQVRAEVRTPAGGTRTTGWTDLSAEDGAAIRHHPLPSHIRQNELRRAWEFYLNSHDERDRPGGLRGDLSQQYLRRIASLRLDRDGVDAVQRLQLRSRTTNVTPPPWSTERTSLKPVYRTLPWWSVIGVDRSSEAAGAPHSDPAGTRRTEASAR